MAAVPEISATDAHQAAGITYRQLDHWARQRWVTPSRDAGTGRSGKRLYAPEDVIRLALLRHLSESRVNAAVAGPAVAQLRIPEGDIRVLWGPVGAKEPGEPALAAVPADEVLARLETGGAFIVFNPVGIRQRLSVLARAHDVEPVKRDERGERRSA